MLSDSEHETRSAVSESQHESGSVTLETPGFFSTVMGYRGFSYDNQPPENNIQMKRVAEFLRLGDGVLNQKTDIECLDFIKRLPARDLNLTTKASGSILNVAAKHNRHTVVQYLLSEGSGFNQVAARSQWGRTAVHDAILRRDKYYNVRLNWTADTPASDALKAMLQHPACDALVNANDDLNNPPFFYALHAYVMSKSTTSSEENMYKDAAIELDHFHDSCLRLLLGHPYMSCPPRAIVDYVHRFQTMIMDAERHCLPEFFEIGSKILHHSGVDALDFGENIFDEDLHEDLKNDMLQFMYGPALRQICSNTRLPDCEVECVLKQFLGFDLVAEKLLRDKKCLHRLIRIGRTDRGDLIMNLAKNIDSRDKKTRWGSCEERARNKVRRAGERLQGQAVYQQLLVQQYFGAGMSADHLQQKKTFESNLLKEHVDWGPISFNTKRLVWHFQQAASLMQSVKREAEKLMEAAVRHATNDEANAEVAQRENVIIENNASLQDEDVSGSVAQHVAEDKPCVSNLPAPTEDVAPDESSVQHQVDQQAAQHVDHANDDDEPMRQQQKRWHAQRRLLLITYSRATSELDNILMGSDLAVEAAERGAELKPAWARDAKIFAEGVLPEHFRSRPLGNRNLVMRPEDECRLEALFAQLPYHLRPRPKPENGRETIDGALPEIPDVMDRGIDTDVVVEQGSLNELSSATMQVGAGGDEARIPYFITRTFIDVPWPEEPASSRQRCASSPPSL